MCNPEEGGQGPSPRRSQSRSASRVFFALRGRSAGSDNDAEVPARPGCGACRYRGRCSTVLQHEAELSPSVSTPYAVDDEPDGRAN